MRQIPSPAGHSLAVHELGGSGRPTLLAHATGLHGAVWEPMAAALAPGLERWAMDFRAHGASVVPPELPLDWAGYTDDVLTVVDGLGLAAGSVFGIGHSMGGAALLMAEQRRPGTFAGLWLFEPIAAPPGTLQSLPGGGNPLAEGAARRRASFPSSAEALANFASKPPLSRLRADALHAYVRHGFVADESGDGSVRLACRPADEARTFQAAGAHDTFARLGEVLCPVVVASGDEGFGPALFAEAITEALPKGRLEPFAQLGHFGPLEAPDRVAAAVSSFAASLDAPVPPGVTPPA
jgi:pimeloyl-ACP methyl ester carboxylesterase